MPTDFGYYSPFLLTALLPEANHALHQSRPVSHSRGRGRAARH